MASNRNLFIVLMDKAHICLEMARYHAQLAKNEDDPYIAMDSDYYYEENMAHAIFYLTHARNLRIKEKTNHGYQF